MVKVRGLESVPFSIYLCLCNELCICTTGAIPSYRVYDCDKNVQTERYSEKYLLGRLFGDRVDRQVDMGLSLT